MTEEQLREIAEVAQRERERVAAVLKAEAAAEKEVVARLSVQLPTIPGCSFAPGAAYLKSIMK